MEGLEMKYFVLKPKGDDEYAEASRRALCAYMDHIEETGCNPELARELKVWTMKEVIRNARNKDAAAKAPAD